jgi:hypothetical protein
MQSKNHYNILLKNCDKSFFYKVENRLHLYRDLISRILPMKSILSIRMLQGPSWSWLYGSWIYNYLCNQCLSPLKLWVRIPLMRGVLDATLCYKVCQWLATGRWFSPGTPVPSTNKTDRLDRTEILLKVALSTITPVIMFNFDLLYIKNTYTRSVCVIDRKIQIK